MSTVIGKCFQIPYFKLATDVMSGAQFVPMGIALSSQFFPKPSINRLLPITISAEPEHCSLMTRMLIFSYVLERKILQILVLCYLKSLDTKVHSNCKILFWKKK